MGVLPLVIAAILTIFFALWTATLAQEEVTFADVTQSRFNHFLAGETNAMGDTLAGFVGSLTLIWVVASVVQQSMELRAQRKEFAEMVSAQDAQVRALEAQASIFAHQKAVLEQDQAKKELDEHLESVRTLIFDLTQWPLQWEYATSKYSSSVFDPTGKIVFIGLDEFDKSENLLRDFERWLRYLEPRHRTAREHGAIIKKSESKRLIEIRAAITSTLTVFNKLGEDQKVRMSVLKLSNTLDNIEALLRLEIWDQATT